MTVRGLILLSAAVGSASFEVNLEKVADLADDFSKHFASDLRAFVHEHSVVQQFPLQNVKNETTCGPCVQRGVKFVMEHAIKKTKEMCAEASKNADSPHACRMAKLCKIMGKHPKVALGMMIEHVRPFSLAKAYCTGKGACEHPDEVTMNEIAMGEEPHEAILSNFDKVDWNDNEEDTEGEMPLPKKDALDFDDGEAKICMKHKPKVCPYCMKVATRKAMYFAIMKTKKMCMEGEKKGCPYMTKMCKWMGEHREVAMGMIAGKVEPWKFAYGYCLHKPFGPLGQHGKFFGHHGRPFMNHHPMWTHHNGKWGNYHHYGMPKAPPQALYGQPEQDVMV